MAYADIDDVALYFAELANPAGDLEDKAERLLEQAENIVHLEFQRASRDLDAAATDPRFRAALEQVEAEMVSAVLKNPNSYLSESASVSGVSESHTLDLKAASGLLRFTTDHRKLLGLPARGRGGAAFTINPSSAPGPRALDAPATVWG